MNLFSSDGFMPHGHCYFWNPSVLRLHVISDALIALAYLTIPITLLYILRRRKDVPFDWIFICFGIFIIACGATHAMEIWTIWHPVYWLSGSLKAIAAVASVATAVLLVKLVPRILAIPSPARLQQANRTLEKEIADRRQAEEALRESEERFRGTFEQAAIGIAHVSTEGRFLRVNDKLCEILCSEREDLVGITFMELTFPDDQAGGQAARRAMLAGENTSYTAEKRYLQKNGNVIWVNLVTTLERTAAGEPKYFISVFQDITQRRQTEDELFQSLTEHKLAKLEIERFNADLEERVAQRTEELFAVTREAEYANRAKSEFLSRSSHELRTPLNAILGFGQLLETEEHLGPEARDSVAQILQAGRRLLILIDKVLDISDAETGGLLTTLERVAVDPLVEEALSWAGPLGVQFQVELEVRPAPGRGWTVLADHRRLKQVLHHVLSNAIQYNHPGGNTILECIPVEASDPPAFRFSVKDTGAGISAENLLRLFTPFDRLDVDRTRTSVAGSGLGLAVSKRLIELMGGRIGVESVLGKGSTFWIEVPLAEEVTG